MKAHPQPEWFVDEFFYRKNRNAKVRKLILK